MTTTLPINTTKWTIDSSQSDVLIKARHSIIAYIAGSSNKFKGSIDIQDNEVEDASIEFVLDLKNTQYDLEKIDSPVIISDYIDNNEFPYISFKSISFQKINHNINFLKGYLTVKDITKVVELDAELVNIDTQNGIKKAIFEVTGQIKSKDFQLAANSYTEAGGIALGPDIKLIANLEFVI